MARIQGQDVPPHGPQARKAAWDTGEELAAYHGLVKMIPQWERDNRARRGRYGLLYLKIFEDIVGVLSPVTQRSRADHVGDGSDTRGTGPHGGR